MVIMWYNNGIFCDYVDDMCDIIVQLLSKRRSGKINGKITLFILSELYKKKAS